MPPRLRGASDASLLAAGYRIAKRHPLRLPTVADLRDEFGISRATAFRWVAILKDACGGKHA